jgi:hypothetical protein
VTSRSLDLALVAELKKGRSLHEIAAARLSDGPRSMLRRCALVRSFDRALFETILRPPELAGDVPFDDFVRLPQVETVVPENPEQSLTGRYRLHDKDRQFYLSQWKDLGGNREVRELSARLVAHFAGQYGSDVDAFFAGQGPDWLYHLPFATPGEAGEAFRRVFEAAAGRFQLARCQDLVALFGDDRRLPDELTRVLDQKRTFLNEYYRSGFYFTREELAEELRLLLAEGDDGPWVLHVHGAGGLGKTMFALWAQFRHCPREQIACARLDLDVDRPEDLAAEPWRLWLYLARQLNAWFGGQFETFLRDLEELRFRDSAAHSLSAGTGAGNPVAAHAAELFGILLKGPITLGKRVLLILDTLEEALIRRGVDLAELLSLFAREVHRRCPGVRLLLSGRHDLSGKDALGQERLPNFQKRFGAAVRCVEVLPFTEDEARKYLIESRGIPAADDRVRAVLYAFRRAARRPAGVEGVPPAYINPLILALYADLFALHPNLTAKDVAETKPDLVYLIQRVLLRTPLELNWTLSYGVVTRRLTRKFFEEVLHPHVLLALARREERARDPVPRLAGEGPDSVPYTPRERPRLADRDAATIWTALNQFAGTSSWVRPAPGGEEGLLFHSDVLEPMRRELRDWPEFHKLNQKARNYFERRANAEPEQWGRWTVEATYHVFQHYRGDRWAFWEKHLRRAHREFRYGSCRALAALALDFLDEAGSDAFPDEEPRAARRLGRSRRAEALLELTRAYLGLARTGQELPPSTARTEARGCFEELRRLREQFPDDVADAVPEGYALLVEGALVKEESAGRRDRLEQALALIRRAAAVPEEGWPRSQDGQRLRHLVDVEEADLLVRLNQPEGIDRFREALRDLESRPAVAHAHLLGLHERLITALIDADRLADAYAECARLGHVRGPDAPAGEGPAGLLTAGRLLAEVAARAGSPSVAVRLAAWLWPAVGRSAPDSAERLAHLRIRAAAARACRDHLQPREALSRCDELTGLLAESSFAAGSPEAMRAAQLREDLRELRALLLTDLGDFHAAFSLLEQSMEARKKLEEADAVHRTRAHIIALQVREMGTYDRALEWLSAELLDFPPEHADRVRYALLRTEWAEAVGQRGEALQALRDAWAVAGSNPSPRERALLAVARLGIGEPPVSSADADDIGEPGHEEKPEESSAEWSEDRADRHRAIAELTAALGDLEAEVRWSLLEPLSRCRTVEELPAELAQRLPALFPDAVAGAMSERLSPRDRQVLALRLAEAYRLVGRDEQASGLLRFAGDLLAGDETGFPLRQLLAAWNRLALNAPPPEEWVVHAARFDAEFADHPWLRGALRVERAQVALAANHPRACRTFLAEAEPLVARQTNLHTRLSDHIQDLRELLDYLESIPTPEGEAGHGADSQSDVTPEDEGPPASGWFGETRWALPITLRLAEGQVEVRAGHFQNEPAMHSMTSNWSAERFFGTTIPRTFDPLSVAFADRLAVGWADFGRGWGRLIPGRLDDCFAHRSPSEERPPDVRLVADPLLHAVPWEVMRLATDTEFLGCNSEVRQFYRLTERASPAATPEAWLRTAAARLSGDASPFDAALRRWLRSLRQELGLPPRGGADARVRAELDRRLRAAAPPARVLILRRHTFRPDAFRADNPDGMIHAYWEAGFEAVDLVTAPEAEQGPPPALLHVFAEFRASADYLYLDLGENLARPSSIWKDTVHLDHVDRLLQAVPDTELKPVVILHSVPLSTSEFDFIQQVLSGNLFAARLYQLGHCQAVIGTGVLAGHGSLRDVYGDALTALGRGGSVHDFCRGLRDQVGRLNAGAGTGAPGPPFSENRLALELGSTGTCLFTHDPDLVPPGAGRAST